MRYFLVTEICKIKTDIINCMCKRRQVYIGIKVTGIHMDASTLKLASGASKLLGLVVSLGFHSIA